MQDEKPLPFDVFISYRWITPDQEWVRYQLYPALCNAGLRVCLDVEDFRPGRDMVLEMTRGGIESHCTLCVITPEYFEHGRLVNFESLAARRRDPGGENSLLIPLILRETELPEWIRGLIPITWTNPADHPREWRKLLQTLEAPNLDAEPPPSIQDPAFPPKAINPRIKRRSSSNAVRRGAGLWQRSHSYVAAVLVVLTLSVLAITKVLPGKSDISGLNPAPSPAVSPQPTVTPSPSPSTTPASRPSPSAPVRSTRSSRTQRNLEPPCPPRDRLFGKC